jgi:hypothetical protein
MEIMKKLTEKGIVNHLKQYGGCRHNPKAMVKSAQVTSRKVGCSPLDVFFLVVENKPIEGLYTHSYGFHTATGRFIIEMFEANYHKSLD